MQSGEQCGPGVPLHVAVAPAESARSTLATSIVEPFVVAGRNDLLDCNYGSAVPRTELPRPARLHLDRRLALDRLVNRCAGPAARDGAPSDLRAAVGLLAMLQPRVA